MIKEIDKNDIKECVDVIKQSFLTVAYEFGFTADNAPRFTWSANRFGKSPRIFNGNFIRVIFLKIN